MQDAVIAGILCFLGLCAIGIAAAFAFMQKTFIDTQTNAVTEIEVPIFGKLKTNTPAIALCFVAAFFGYLAYGLMRGRNAQLVNFDGEVKIDNASMAGIDVVMVGITSGSWIQPTTANGGAAVPVKISVPDTWPSYTAFAFAMGSAKTKPALIGASLKNPTFKLNIDP